jgi:hypothetical protein
VAPVIRALYFKGAPEMNQDESIAEKYLKQLGKVEFEPDGNIPPDFVLDNNIAIEVRRLNQQYRENGESKGLEEVSIPLRQTVMSILSQHHVSDTDRENRYWLALCYARNVPRYNELKKAVTMSIQDFEASGEALPFRYQLTETVELVFIAKAGNTDQKYSLGFFLDRDSGGLVVDMYVAEINYCANEKSQKISPYQTRYLYWWLLLVDHIELFDNYSKTDILAGISKPSNIDKVIVINASSANVIEI